MEWIDPRELLTTRRLDYVIKWRFFRHLLDGGDPDSERVYRWHIQARTGGVERGSWKRSLDDYVTGCHRLLASLQERNFDPAGVVTIGGNGIVARDGAHRIAATMALDIMILIQRDPQAKGPPWGSPSFERAGMAKSDLKRVWADFRALCDG